LPCLAKTRQGFLWFEKIENSLNFPNKIGLFCLLKKFSIIEMDTTFTFGNKERQFLLFDAERCRVRRIAAF